jgi:uncharacterized protein YndB with AHSA1/START domain
MGKAGCMTEDAGLVAKAGMLIRRPVAEVFEAFADPAGTARFWFSKGSGRLEEGARVRWEWEMYGAGSDVLVKAVEPGRRILIDWDEPATQVEWTFEARGPGRTWVEVENRGFHGIAEERVARALDSAGGFALVLAGAKIWLEHGIEPCFVIDRHPDAVVEAWRGR